VGSCRRSTRAVGSSTSIHAGWGLSDRIGSAELPTLEAQMGDVLAVMDAVGSERAVLLGTDSTGPLAILFAATHPERTVALILYATYARGTWAPDYPNAWTDERWDEYEEELERRWGQPDFVREFVKWLAPTLTLDDQALETWTTFFRITGGPGTAVAQATIERGTDVRHVLPPFTFQRWSCTGPTIRCMRLTTGATSPSTSRAHDSSSSAAVTI
jgi:pimeloyl-ACP methyl ester carboxylesterase